ncbi:MAG TPA: radical SAM protein [Anaerolineales bacterium]|nr:radical SAM protein [Anaerolineales bacterium]
MHEEWPAYVGLHASGELADRAARARDYLACCVLCGRRCRVDRNVRPGVCRLGVRARVASWGPHHGEEDPLRGWRGSGTIFFGSCNLRCLYCQNYSISQALAGPEVDAPSLAAIMLDLQHAGCHNINLVSPSHVVAPILEALVLACEAGLRLPLVYNTGGYDSQEALNLLDGVVDIYMPDMKYASTSRARRLSRVLDYPTVNRAAVREMVRQVGDLVLDEDGLAVRGLLVRHLVLPGGLGGTAAIVDFLAKQVSPNTYLNLMDQYRPAFLAREHPPLDRRITSEEFALALSAARKAGLTRLDGTIEPCAVGPTT